MRSNRGIVSVDSDLRSMFTGSRPVLVATAFLTVTLCSIEPSHGGVIVLQLSESSFGSRSSDAADCWEIAGEFPRQPAHEPLSVTGHFGLSPLAGDGVSARSLPGGGASLCCLLGTARDLPKSSLAAWLLGSKSVVIEVQFPAGLFRPPRVRAAL